MQLNAEEAAVQRVHERAPVIDAHADLPAPYDWTAGNVPTADDDQISPARLKAGKVDAQVIAVFVPQGPQTPEAIAAALTEAERKALAIRLRADSDGQDFVLATTADDIQAAEESGRTAIIISLLNAYPLQSSFRNLDAFYQLGVRIIGLTHATDLPPS